MSMLAQSAKPSEHIDMLNPSALRSNAEKLLQDPQLRSAARSMAVDGVQLATDLQQLKAVYTWLADLLPKLAKFQSGMAQALPHHERMKNAFAAITADFPQVVKSLSERLDSATACAANVSTAANAIFTAFEEPQQPAPPPPPPMPPQLYSQPLKSLEDAQFLQAVLGDASKLPPPLFDPEEVARRMMMVGTDAGFVSSRSEFDPSVGEHMVIR